MADEPSGFDAATTIARLHYNLRDYGGEGDVPQPTTAEIRKFREQVYAVQERVSGIGHTEGLSEEELDAALKKLRALTPEQRDEIADANFEAVVEICKGHPSRETLEALPAALRYEFVNWLAGELAPLF